MLINARESCHWSFLRNFLQKNTCYQGFFFLVNFLIKNIWQIFPQKFAKLVKIRKTAFSNFSIFFAEKMTKFVWRKKKLQVGYFFITSNFLIFIYLFIYLSILLFPRLKLRLCWISPFFNSFNFYKIGPTCPFTLPVKTPPSQVPTTFPAFDPKRGLSMVVFYQGFCDGVKVPIIQKILAIYLHLVTY